MVRKALVRRPSPLLADGIVTHIDREAADVELALQQWQGYVEALQGQGWDVFEVEPAPDCPDSVFIEDPVVVFGDLAVLTSLGALERRDEVKGVAEAVSRHGYSVEQLRLPGTLDGGDVLKVGNKVYVGLSGRTNHEGIAQLAALVEPRGFRVITVPLTKVLHLKSAVTALPDGTVVGYPPLVDSVEAFENFLAVPEESGSHVVVLDDNTVLMADSAPNSAELFAGRGLDVVTVDISEFEKLEGCVTCLSVRLRDAPR
ncbi:methionine sulfoxide reductase [Platysternon megacephalum]|uniref:Methionine sulfoxide reductase n=1 Tax=Platysternon megacephalum TaxID=55544 RepID=A0A4D9DEZ4_9SAUR|nr:methionine sulfoxide reductase [Platysternon megacephalum]